MSALDQYCETCGAAPNVPCFYGGRSTHSRPYKEAGRAVPPVTFSALGDDGRFTVLLSEDVVRDLAHVRNSIDCPSALIEAAREALAVHDRDGRLDELTEAAFVDLARLTDITDMDANYVRAALRSHFANAISGDLAKGTEA